MRKINLLIVLLVCLLACFSSSKAGMVDVIGSYTDWSSVDWRPIVSQNDSVDAGVSDSYLDIVGSGNDSAAYWSDNGSYVFFRMRLKDPEMVTTYDDGASNGIRGSYLIMIDVQGSYYDTTSSGLVPGANDGLPDYAFAWDAKSNDPSKHGLEMSTRPTPNWNNGTLWNGINFDDIDGSDGQKLANDINGNGRDTDGYIEIVDGISTSDSDFSTTSYLDFAVSLDYLAEYTDLDLENQQWIIGLATIADATDHNNINSDVGAGDNPTDTAIMTGEKIPEPATITMLLSGLIGIAIKRKK